MNLKLACLFFVPALACTSAKKAAQDLPESEALPSDSGTATDERPANEELEAFGETVIEFGKESSELTPMEDAQDLVFDDGLDEGSAANDKSEATAPLPCTIGTDTCPEGQHCIPAGEGDAPVCVPYGSNPVGAYCIRHEDCEKGAICAQYSDEIAMCKYLCGPEGSNLKCPKSFQVCIPYFGPDGKTAGVCIGSDCDPFEGGCPTGQRCTVLANLVFDCVPAGEAGPGDDCSVGECQPGLVCFYSEGKAKCVPFCRSANDCTAVDDHCVYPWSFTEIGYCRAGCDPVLQEGCKPQEGCYFSDPEVGSTLCFDAGTLDEGADCSNFTVLCKPGLDCILQPGSNPYEYYCRAWCDSAHPCPEGSVCTTTLASPVMPVCLPK